MYANWFWVPYGYMYHTHGEVLFHCESRDDSAMALPVNWSSKDGGYPFFSVSFEVYRLSRPSSLLSLGRARSRWGQRKDSLISGGSPLRVTSLVGPMFFIDPSLLNWLVLVISCWAESTRLDRYAPVLHNFCRKKKIRRITERFQYSVYGNKFQDSLFLREMFHKKLS